MNSSSASANWRKALAACALAAIGFAPQLSHAAGDYPAVTFDRLTNAQSDPGWLTYYRTYDGQ